MKYSDKQRLDKIIATSERLSQYISSNSITPEKVMADYAVQWTVTTPLYNIGEQTYNISTEMKDQYPDVSWAKVSGLRHRLVHDYEGTNWSIVTDVIFKELEPFTVRLRQIRDELN